MEPATFAAIATGVMAVVGNVGQVIFNQIAKGRIKAEFEKEMRDYQKGIDKEMKDYQAKINERERMDRQDHEKQMADYKSGVDEKLKRLEADLKKDSTTFELEQEKRYQFASEFCEALEQLRIDVRAVEGQIILNGRLDKNEFNKSLVQLSEKYSAANNVYSRYKPVLGQEVVNRIDLYLLCFQKATAKWISMYQKQKQRKINKIDEEINNVHKYAFLIIGLLDVQSRMSTKVYDSGEEAKLIKDVASGLGINADDVFGFIDNFGKESDEIEL